MADWAQIQRATGKLPAGSSVDARISNGAAVADLAMLNAKADQDAADLENAMVKAYGPYSDEDWGSPV